MMMAIYDSMPDLHLTIEDMIAEGDKVMCRNIWRWADKASGKNVQFHGFVLWRFEGEKSPPSVHRGARASFSVGTICAISGGSGRRSVKTTQEGRDDTRDRSLR